MRRKTLTFVGMAWGLLLFPHGAATPSSAQPERERPAPAVKAAHRGPQLAFDYKAFIAQHLELVGAGEIDRAVDHLKARIRNPAALPNVTESLKRSFATVFGAAGPFEGHEIYGYKQLGSRIYQFHVMAYFANGPMRFTYTFEERAGEWKWLNFGFQVNIDEAAKDAPLQPIDSQ